jgi:hypothetical protein
LSVLTADIGTRDGRAIALSASSIFWNLPSENGRSFTICSTS